MATGNVATKIPVKGVPSSEHEIITPEISNFIASPGEKYLRYRSEVPRFDLGQIPFFDWLFHQRWWQFVTAFPNVVIFNLVLVAGFIGVTDPNVNFATVITWYLWFTVVFFLMIGVGRGWCLICPFSAQSEWIQRLSIWGKNKHNLTLNKKWPAMYSTVLISIIFFVILTFFEEYFNIAGPGLPFMTATIVLGIITWDIFYALVFERRSFCRYGCPLTGIIGVVSSMSPFDGYRTKNPDICKRCRTKECMRGSDVSYGCPWYEYPGSMSTNFNCGICTECVKGCPHNNIGLAARVPVADTWAPKVKKFDIALSVTLLLGLTWFQMFNALPFYTTMNNYLNNVTGWYTFSRNSMMLHGLGSYYPNPLDFVAFVLLGPAIMLLLSYMGYVISNKKYGIKKLFTLYSYALIPLFAGTILARQFPKLLTNSDMVPKYASSPMGFKGWNLLGTLTLPAMYNSTTPVYVWQVQVITVIIFGILSIYAAYKLLKVDFDGSKESKRVFAIMVTSFILLIIMNAVLYYYMAFFNGMSAPF